MECDEPIPKHDYSQDYFTFEALEDGTFQFTKNALQYSVDGGKTWETLAANTATPTITAGSKILWKQTGLTPGTNSGIGRFYATGKFNVSGNIMSLYYGDDFIEQTDLTGKEYTFNGLFYTLFKLVSAENLILPATTLANYCYGSMFQFCTSLTTAPELPATTLANSCYNSMFYGCTSLTSAPKLPATRLAENCYYNMFNGCTSLTTAPELPATTLANSCYNSMFYGCTSLTTAPELPATTLAQYCYSYMFNGCTSLTSAPELPATTLANNCYSQMFNGCKSLTSAPSILPATTLATSCYYAMFISCTSLTTAPELPATKLANDCYTNMFSYCNSLEYLKILYTGSGSPGSMEPVSMEGDLYLYSLSLASNNNFLRGFNGWRLYVNNEYSGIINVHGGGCGCCGGCGGCGC